MRTSVAGRPAPLLSLPLGVASVALLVFGQSWTAQEGLVIASATVVGAFALLLWHARRLTVGVVVGAFYLAFHFGLVVPLSLRIDVPILTSADTGWTSAPVLAWPAILAASFMSAFAATCLACGMAPAGDDDGRRSQPSEGRGVDGAAEAGTVALVTGTVLWGAIFLQSGSGIIGSYATFLAGTQGSATPYAYLLISVGVGAIAASRTPGVRRTGLALFGLWSIPAFMLGLRGEVLIPLLAYLVTRARTGELNIRARSVAVLGLIALSLGSAVRVLRIGGDVTAGAFNPFGGLAELGYTIRPMVMVVNTQASLGEGFVGIRTYTAPFERLIVARAFGYPMEPASTDQDVFSTFIGTRFGPIGGSISAEAFRAGGGLGLIAVAVAVGLLCCWFDRLRQSLAGNVVVGMSTAVLLMWVRNDITPIALSASAIAIVWIYVRMRDGRTLAARSRGRRACTHRVHASHARPPQAMSGHWTPNTSAETSSKSGAAEGIST